jgi:signal transduction histidine kinase/ActR/RegA family two-component response regulator
MVVPILVGERVEGLLYVGNQVRRPFTDDDEVMCVRLAAHAAIAIQNAQLFAREQAARAEAETANRAKDEFLAVLSHELRTPLNAIMGWTRMLQAGALDAGQAAHALDVIDRNTRQQAQLINDLLDVSRIIAGKLDLDRYAVDVVPLVGAAVEALREAITAKSLTLETDLDPATGEVYGDPLRLQQIVTNLVSNAVKFTPEGGAVLVSVRRIADLAELVVMDNGEGIAADFLPWVFERFRQADGSTTRPDGGLGLGLSIVKHLVEAHGGTIRVESEGAGKGAAFTVRLPIVPVPAEQSEREGRLSACPDSAVATLAGLSLLVVDDDDGNREVVTAQLQDCQATVLTAASVEEALSVLHSTHVDVLIADLAMPRQDGYALIRKVRASHAPRVTSIPAVALTAFAREDDRQRALEAGFNVHLAKPIDAGSLASAIASLGRINVT